MANFSPEEHRLGVALKFHILQPGELKLSHGPRLKFFKRDPKQNFSVPLSEDPQDISAERIVGDPLKLIQRSELSGLIRKIQKYRYAFLCFWYDPTATISETTALLDLIDQGKEGLVREYYEKIRPGGSIQSCLETLSR